MAGTGKIVALINALTGSGIKALKESKADAITSVVNESPVASFSDGADGMPLSAVVQINPVQDTSGGDPSPSHICPISGWTGCTVTVANGDDPTATGYSATEYPVSWQTAAGTVYKGYVDLIAQTLTVTFGSKIIDGTVNKAANLTGPTPDTSEYTHVIGKYAVDIADLENDVPYNAGTQKCSHFKWLNYTGRKGVYPDQIYYATSGRIVRWASDTFTTLDEFNQYLVDQNTAGTPVTLIYPLATPVVYNLSDLPTITTLLGENHIWADCGNVSVEYTADTKLYVDGLVNPAVAMVATDNIPSGTYFMIGNKLYLSTESIASGTGIVPGAAGNCTEMTIADALNALGE